MPLQFTSWSICLGIFIPYDAGLSMNIDYIRGARHYLSLAVVATMALNLSVLISFFVWSHVLHFHFPMPFVCIIGQYSAMLSCIVALYFSIPHKWRIFGTFRRRWKMWICKVIADGLIIMQYGFASEILLSLIHIWRCRRIERCRSRWSPYH